MCKGLLRGGLGGVDQAPGQAKAAAIDLIETVRIRAAFLSMSTKQRFHQRAVV